MRKHTKDRLFPLRVSDDSYLLLMPRVAYFFGISIYMYLGDHGVPHCHAIYGDYGGAFSIEKAELLAGQMPPAQTKKIIRFIIDNKEDLMEKWNELSG